MPKQATPPNSNRVSPKTRLALTAALSTAAVSATVVGAALPAAAATATGTAGTSPAGHVRSTAAAHQAQRTRADMSWSAARRKRTAQRSARTHQTTPTHATPTHATKRAHITKRASTPTRTSTTDSAPALPRRWSDNWAGYTQHSAEVGGRVTSVSASWRVPRVTAHGRGEQAAADWVGVGGDCIDPSCRHSDPTLIQAGATSQVGRSGHASSFTWFETLPSAPVTTPLAAAAGNRLTIAIARTSPSRWRIALANADTGKSWSTTVRYRSGMSSADWITERPQLSGSGGTSWAKLPSRTPTHFQAARVNGRTAHLRPSQAVSMTEGGRTIASPSVPTGHGDAFTVCGSATTCATGSHR